MSTDSEDSTEKTSILDMVDDLVGAFLYYDRKECEEFEIGEIEVHIIAGFVSVDEIVKRFEERLGAAVQNRGESRG
ncbi:MAG: hypothetical protein ACXQTL_05510 [Methanosarcinales archaeon]